MIEAGCWQGGSTAKFSLAAQELGYRLAVYDSFEGVEPIGPETAGETDYSGQYAVAQEIVETNVRHYGAFDVCSFHKGWFSETLSPDTVPTPLRMVYIDCDLAKGTAEVLDAVQPHVTANTLVYSQDAHIPTVKDLLAQRARVIEPVAWSTVRLTL